MSTKHQQAAAKALAEVKASNQCHHRPSVLSVDQESQRPFCGDCGADVGRQTANTVAVTQISAYQWQAYCSTCSDGVNTSKAKAIAWADKHRNEAHQ